MYDHYFSNFGRPPVPDDLRKDSAPRHPQFWRRRFLKVFTIYGHGCHLGQQAATILAIFCSPNLRRLHMKIASEEKSFENVNGRTDARTDRRTHWQTDGWKVITIAHPEHNSGELKKLLKSASISFNGGKLRQTKQWKRQYFCEKHWGLLQLS